MYSIITSIIISIFTSFTFIYISSKLLACDINYKKFKYYIKIIIYIIIFTLINLYLKDNFLRLTCLLLLNTILIKIVYHQSINKTILISSLIFILLMISETFYTFIVIFFSMKSNEILTTNSIFISLLLNFITLIIACLITVIFKRKLRKLIEKLDENFEASLFIYLIIILSFIIMFINNNEIEKNTLIINAFVIVTFIIFFVLMLKEKLKYKKSKEKLEDMYQNTDFLIETLDKYRKLNHKTKNDFILIRSMIKSNANKEAIKIIDEILEDINMPNFTKKFDNISSIKLRNFLLIKYKEIQDKNINLNLEISKEASIINFDNIIQETDIKNFYRILGILLDNAIEGTSECKNKQMTIDIYTNEGDYIINIANNFNSKIDLDKIYKYGYSTKGKERGYGLSLLNEIIKSSSIFDINQEVVKNVFYSELKIHMSKNQTKSQ